MNPTPNENALVEAIHEYEQAKNQLTRNITELDTCTDNVNRSKNRYTQALHQLETARNNLQHRDHPAPTPNLLH